MNRSSEKYSISEVCKVTGLSRASILYYEKIGLVTPRKNRINGYREFSIRDFFKIKTTIMLVNIGYSIKEASEIIKNNDALSEQLICQYVQKLSNQILIKKAAIDNLLSYKSMQFKEGEIIELCPSVYYFSPDGCEISHHNMIDNEVNSELIRNLPVSGFAGIFPDYLNAGSSKSKWGRAIDEKYVNLFNLDTSQMIRLGGTHCIAFTTSNSDADNYGSDYKLIDTIKRYLDDHSLIPEGLAFAPYTLTNGTPKLISTMYMPVKLSK